MSPLSLASADAVAKPARGAARRRRWARLRPKSVAGQIALLVIAAIVATHVVAAIMLFLLREPWNEDRPGVAANRVAFLARLLDATSEPSERAAVLASAAKAVPILRIAPWDGIRDGTAAGDSAALREVPVVERLREAFGRTLIVTDLSDAAPDRRDTDVLRIGLRTPGGATFRAALPDDVPGPPKRIAIVFTFVFLATTLALLSAWAARALTAPLAQLAGAAEAFGTRRQPPPLPTHGPQEVLALAGALDRMRARVARLLDDRTQMLAAIGHDLRTPITRLRLRAEFIEDDHARERTLRDLDQMNALVEAALNYARGERSADGLVDDPRERPLVDLASLARTVCDGFVDTGADVRMQEECGAARRLLVRARPEDLERALTNLVDNAVKYGTRARLAVARSDGSVTITVDDDGPGIPEAERQAMLQPFVRGDRARSRDEAGGFGLGLSIVAAIVEAHGGRLSLEDREAGDEPGGLRARIELPATPDGAGSGRGIA